VKNGIREEYEKDEFSNMWGNRSDGLVEKQADKFLEELDKLPGKMSDKKAFFIANWYIEHASKYAIKTVKWIAQVCIEFLKGWK
jgi:hypothetical protein